jgi:hypothetical protein
MRLCGGGTGGESAVLGEAEHDYIYLTKLGGSVALEEEL